MKLPELIGGAWLLGRGDAETGAENASALVRAGVRPAIFDVSCLLYRLLYAKAKDYCRAGSDESAAHLAAADVIWDVADACRSFSCAPVLAFDSIASYRKALFPDYKSGRGGQKRTPEQEHMLGLKGAILKLLKGLYCPAYSIQSFCVYGYESDDVIASLVLGLKMPHGLQGPPFAGRVAIVSSDADLHQLVLDGVLWADVAKGALCGPSDLQRHTGVAPGDVVLAKCVGGCHSDAIPGVPGCGDKTVMELLETRSPEVSLRKAREALASAKGAAIIERNFRLIRLPFEWSPPMPKLFLSEKTWPVPGVPERIGAIMEANGVPVASRPFFHDVRSSARQDALPSCTYVGRGTDAGAFD